MLDDMSYQVALNLYEELITDAKANRVVFAELYSIDKQENVPVMLRLIVEPDDEGREHIVAAFVAGIMTSVYNLKVFQQLTELLKHGRTSLFALPAGTKNGAIGVMPFVSVKHPDVPLNVAGIQLVNSQVSGRFVPPSHDKLKELWAVAKGEMSPSAVTPDKVQPEEPQVAENPGTHQLVMVSVPTRFEDGTHEYQGAVVQVLENEEIGACLRLSHKSASLLSDSPAYVVVVNRTQHYWRLDVCLNETDGPLYGIEVLMADEDPSHDKAADGPQVRIRVAKSDPLAPVEFEED